MCKACATGRCIFACNKRCRACALGRQVGSPECMIEAEAQETLLLKFALTVRNLMHYWRVTIDFFLSATHLTLHINGTYGGRAGCVQHAAFLYICVFLTVPACTAHFRSTEHRTLHSINVSATSAVDLLLDWGVLRSQVSLKAMMMAVAGPGSNSVLHHGCRSADQKLHQDARLYIYRRYKHSRRPARCHLLAGITFTFGSTRRSWADCVLRACSSQALQNARRECSGWAVVGSRTGGARVAVVEGEIASNVHKPNSRVNWLA